MRRRLLALLVVALVSGVVAGTVASANGTPAAREARIPPLPALREITDTCPPLAMLVAVGQVESNLTADARSSADARGLLQVLPATAAALRLDVDRPSSNLLAGARYLEQLLEQFHSTDLALAAYNAGPTAVAATGGAPTQETLDYVANVTSLWRELRGCR
jgi:membrane-bound lytic murein transglycosylase MltF